MSAPYSVLMSVYNKEKPEYLTQAIESMLGQTVPPDEVVLVCDGPLTEGLDAVIERYEKAQGESFKTVRLSENSGLGEALRIGLPECRNELVARMDSDDISLPSRMAVLLKVLEDDSRLSVVGGQISEFVGNPSESAGIRRVPLLMEGIKKMLPMRNPMNHVTVLFRKSDVLSVGGYTDLKGFEDYFLWTRLLAEGFQLANVGEVVCNVRVSKNMYKNRRGGMKYFRSAQCLFEYMLDFGLCTKGEYLKCLFVRFCQCAVPASVRELVFKRLLRVKQ